MIQQDSAVAADGVCPHQQKKCADDAEVCTRIINTDWQPKYWKKKGVPEPLSPFDEKQYQNYWSLSIPFPESLMFWKMPTFWWPGDGSWCIDFVQFARLEKNVGCDNLDVDWLGRLTVLCGATSVAAIEKKYPQAMEGDVNLQPAKDCLNKLCAPGRQYWEGDSSAPSVVDEGVILVSRSEDAIAWHGAIAVGAGAIGAAAAAMVALLRRSTLLQRAPSVSLQPLVG